MEASTPAAPAAPAAPATPAAPAYSIDGAPCTGPAFYAAACDPRRSVVVEACAGAGKTWMLVSRIVRALLAGVAPQQVLAITFTRRAAGEMRQRLDDWLRAWATPNASHAERVAALRERGLAPGEAEHHAPALGALHGVLLAAGQSVRIRTFHGWFAQLLAHAPLQLLAELDLPPQPQLLEDPAPLAAELFRRFHRRVDADADLRADYLALVVRHRRHTVERWLQTAWWRGTEIETADRAGTLTASLPPAAALWPSCAGLDSPLRLLWQPPLHGLVDALARHLGRASTKKLREAGAQLRAALDSPADPAAAFDRAWFALHRKDKRDVRLKLAEDPVCDAACDALLQLRDMHEQQLAHDDQQRMMRLSRVLLAEFAALKRRRGLADMPDLERAALALLGDPALAGHVQQRLDQHLSQLLIDEFQDTSPLQWQALHGWLSGYAGAGGGSALSLFVVGDPKQSIYRFRRAEPRVFDAARDFVVRGLGGRVLACDHTQRNAPAVVQALNAVFADAAEADGWTPFRPHSTASDATGSVRALPGVERPPRATKELVDANWRDSLTVPRFEVEVRLRQQEAAHVASGVAALVADGVPPGKIMVLSRWRETLRWVAAALAERQLPHAAPEDLQAADVPEALDLTALLDVLASPGHDLSLARALKSPVFGAADADLAWLMQQARDAQLPWLPALTRAETPPTPALQRAQTLLAGWVRAAERLPPHDVLDRIVDEGDVMARLAAAVPAARRAGAVRAVQALLAAALEHDSGRHASVYAFVRALKAGRVQLQPGSESDAVQLLTIHGAKGLEADAVFLVDTEPERRNPETSTLLVDWPVDSAAPRCAAFVARESRMPYSLRRLFGAECRARDREELNAFYVALTRARRCLVFSRTEPYNKPLRRTWWHRVAAHAAAWEPAGVALVAPLPPQPSVAVLPALTWAPQPAAAGAADDPAAARLGQAVHRALEWIGQPGGRALQPVAAATAAAAAFGTDVGAVRRVVERVLAGNARFFDAAALRWAGNEVALADAAGVMRIDRLVRLADGWWVLDYKLATTADGLAAYRDQMARYVAAVRAAQPGEPVHGAFIAGDGACVVI